MPRRKSTKTTVTSPRSVRKVSRGRRVTNKAIVPETAMASTLPILPKTSLTKFFTVKYAIFIVILILVALVVWRNKNWVVVADVNGQPITRWQLDNQLVSSYGTQTLDEMVNETLVRQAAAKKGITISSADVDAKVADIEKSLNGQISLTDALAQQGMTMQQFRGQVEIQLILEKMTADQTKVTDAEIADYITANKSTMTATDTAELTTEATTALQSQKRSDAIQKLLSSLQSQAKISKYL